MEKREYSPKLIQFWIREIKKAEKLVSDAEADPFSHESDYFIQLDPEDFLDLCAGKWHA